MRFAEATSSLRPSAGGANEEAAFRARECRPATRSGSLLAAAPSPPNQGPDFSRTRLTFERPGAPRAFRGFDELDFRPTGLLDTLTEGAGAAPFDASLAAFRLPGAPFPRRERPRYLVQARCLHLRSTSHPRGASRRFLGCTVKMLRIHFYNRRFASRAPVC